MNDNSTKQILLKGIVHVVPEKTANSDDIISIMLKIWDAAITRHPDSISTRDVYRSVKAIALRAKEAKREVGAYTAELWGLLGEILPTWFRSIFPRT